MVICLELGADLHMAQLMSLSLASVKSRLVLPFWYRLTQVVPEKGPLNGCVCVCVCVCVMNYNLSVVTVITLHTVPGFIPLPVSLGNVVIIKVVLWVFLLSYSTCCNYKKCRKDRLVESRENLLNKKSNMDSLSVCTLAKARAGSWNEVKRRWTDAVLEMGGMVMQLLLLLQW